MTKRVRLADGLHQAREVGEARGLFEEAERMQHEEQVGYGYLYGLAGYQYCDLLISLGEYEEVKERARQALERTTQMGWLLDMGLDKLSLGSCFAKASQDMYGRARDESLNEAKRWLDEAVDGLRKAGEQIWIARGLLARAGYWRAVGDCEKALGELEEAREIAERGGMKLWLADYHLESARVARSEKDKEKMAEHYGEAKRLVEECGYHRRDGDLELIKDY
jgi:tetratricopeptide (TPR) repeat protein